MPIRGGATTSHKPRLADKFKRRITLALVAVAAIGALDQLGMTRSSLAQIARSVGRLRRPDQADGGDCTYLKAPDNFRGAQARHRETVSRTTEAVSGNLNLEQAPVYAGAIPRKNMIDAILFDKMERDNVASAPLCSDQEFIRRVTLDLTGRIPSPEDVTAFLQDQTATKRDALLDNLLGS